MTNALLAIIAATLIVGVALLARRSTSREHTRDDDQDLTRRRSTPRPPDPSRPGAPEWTPPGRDPEARA